MRRSHVELVGNRRHICGTVNNNFLLRTTGHRRRIDAANNANFERRAITYRYVAFALLLLLKNEERILVFTDVGGFLRINGTLVWDHPTVVGYRHHKGYLGFLGSLASVIALLSPFSSSYGPCLRFEKAFTFLWLFCPGILQELSRAECLSQDAYSILTT